MATPKNTYVGMVGVKKFFEEGPNGSKCTAKELKALSPKDRIELKTLLDEEVA